MGHPEVYKLNEELLKQWAEDVVEIRKNIMKKVELYETYSSKDKNPEKPKKSWLDAPYST